MHAWGKLYLGCQLCLDDVAELDRHSRYTARAATYAARVWVQVVLVLSVTHETCLNSNLEAWSPYTSLTKTAAKPTLYGVGYTS